MAFKISSNIEKVSKELCVSILRAYGGSSAIANSLNWNRQNIHMYIRRGFVPFGNLYDLSKLLEVSQWTLSYFKLLEVFGEESLTIESVIKKSPLLPAEKKRILAMLT